MKMNRIVIALLSLSLVISSTGYARYKSIPLNRSLRKAAVISQDTINFDYKIFKAKDCKKHLNSKYIIKHGFQPIQIIITNNSNNNIAISANDFSFPLVNCQDVADSLHRNGFARGLGFGIGALGCWPLVIPALVEGFGANDFNACMDRDFENKTLEPQIIPPYTTVNGLIFVDRQDFTKDFTCTVKNESKNESIVFPSRKFSIK
jgi:hypothetical protein